MIACRAALAALLVTAIAACGSINQPPPPVPLEVWAHPSTAVYCTDGGTQLTLDLFRPSQATGPHPLLIVVHGGSWSFGDSQMSAQNALTQKVAYQLLARGFAVASVNYRLAPHNPWPAQIIDVRCAVRYLRGSAGQWGLDPARFVVLGNSAGGQLGSLLALSDGKVPEWDNGQHAGTSTAVSGVVDLWGPADLVAPGWSAEAVRTGKVVFRAGLGTVADELRQASPVTFAHAGSPPFLIVQGTADTLVAPPQSRELRDRLLAAGSPATVVEVANAGHELLPAGGAISPSVDQLTAQVVTFVAVTAAARTAAATSLDPLTIAAMRARAYPASAITAVRSDGEQGGYVNTVVSFISDGLTEYALQSVPDGPRPPAGWPVVIVNHGYTPPTMYVTDDGAYSQFIAAFARAGYMVLKPDYRGNGRSQGVPQGGHLSPVYTWDLLNLISTVKADPRVDHNRIGLYGHSMGGHEALRAMVVSKDVKAVVFMAGVVGSFYDLFYNWPRAPVATDSTTAMQQQVGQSVVDVHGAPPSPSPSPPATAPGAHPSPGNPPTPMPANVTSFWDAASAINFVSSSDAAVQIDQDVADSQVPKLFADHLAAALTSAGKPYEYILYPGDDHQFHRNRAAILANAVAFFRAHL